MYKVFTDGSSSRKRKSIGSAYIVFEDSLNNKIAKFSKGFVDEEGRNGIAEILAVYYFLYNLCNNQFLNKNKEIIIYSDSQYVVNEFNIWYKAQLDRGFYEVKNLELIIYILWMLYILREEGYIIKFKWVKGHQKEESEESKGNNLVDILAVECHNELIELEENIEDLILNLKEDIKRDNLFQKIKNIYS